ncbi:MAG: hypothetical protein QM705_03055 [Ancrocorticia sp.]
MTEMSITTTTVGASPRTVKKQSGIVSLLLATLLALGSVLGVSTAANAAAGVSVQTYKVQQGAYQTFFVSGLAANTKYTAVLSTDDNATHVASKTFTTTSSGKAPEKYMRMVVAGNAAKTNNYEVRLRLGTATSGTPVAATSSPSIEVVAPNTTAKITSITVNPAKTKVTVVGEGFRRTNTAHNSVIGIKLDNGAIKHANTTADRAPVPKPYPAAGSSPEGVWFYIGDPNTSGTGSDATYNGSTGYPNAAYADDNIVGGSFTVEIPIGSIPAGTHTLLFLTGSLANTNWQIPTGAVSPDVPRAVTESFTK